MKKSHLVLLGVMALTAGHVNANTAAAKAETQVAIHDEANFVATLSQMHKDAFALMSTELKNAVFVAAEGATPDAAVEKVMKDHNLALVDGKLQANQ